MMFVAGMLASVAGGLWWAASLSGRLRPVLMPPAQVESRARYAFQ
jgi:hypothetical protein